MEFAQAQRVNLILLFDQQTIKFYFDELPDLENKKIIGIQTFLRGQANGQIIVNGIPYNEIPQNLARDYMITFVAKGKEEPLIHQMPFLSFPSYSDALTTNPKIPGGNIKPFDIEINTRQSYAESPAPTFQPYYLPFLFYTQKN